jgi:HAD superfamily hydrolase (TIGR01549 family)
MDQTVIGFNNPGGLLPLFQRSYRKVLKEVSGRDHSNLTGNELFKPIAFPNGESRRILKSWGVMDPGVFWRALAKEDLRVRKDFKDYIAAYPDVLEMFRRIPKQTKKFILTNTPPEITKFQLEHAGIAGEFECVYTYYYNEGHSKPDPWAILKEMKTRGLEPHEVAMVGDNYCDTNTGLKAGVVTAQLCREGHHHSIESKPHVKGKDLVEVLDCLTILTKEKFYEMQMR